MLKMANQELIRGGMFSRLLLLDVAKILGSRKCEACSRPWQFGPLLRRGRDFGVVEARAGERRESLSLLEIAI